MSVTITGMEMPKDCISCPFCDYEEGLCLAANYMDTAPRTIGKRHGDCPLVEVPPHGRWIVDDITELIKCSKCKNDAPLDTTGGGQWRSPFCPSCGARMDGPELPKEEV